MNSIYLSDLLLAAALWIANVFRLRAKLTFHRKPAVASQTVFFLRVGIFERHGYR